MYDEYGIAYDTIDVGPNIRYKMAVFFMAQNIKAKLISFENLTLRI